MTLGSRDSDPTKPSMIRDADKEVAALIEKNPYILVDCGLDHLDPDGEELLKKREKELAKHDRTERE